MTFPTLIVEFSPTTGPFDTPTWISLSEGGPHGNRVYSADWQDGKQADLSEFPPGEATIVLKNDDRLFDPEHATGTYFGDLNPRVPFRIRATHNEVLELLMWDTDALEWDVDALAWGETSHDLFYGFVEDGWEQTYHPPEGSTCTVKLVDLLGVLPGYTLPSVLEAEILADNVKAYWPLDETSGTSMADHSGNVLDGEYVTGTTDLAGSIGSLPALILDGEHSGYLPTPMIDPNEFTVEALIDLGQARDLADGDRLCIAEFAGPYQNHWFGIEVMDAATHTVRMVHHNIDSPNQDISPQFTANQPRHVMVRSNSGFTPVRDYWLDGAVMAAAGFSEPSPPTYTGVASGQRVGGSKANGMFNGGLAHVARMNSSISSARIAAHASAALAPLDQQRSDQQIQWALDAIGVPATMYDLDQGKSVMGAASTVGKDALEFIRAVTRTEQGAFYVNHSDGGKLKFRQRYASFQDTRSTVVQVTFSDDPAASFDDVARVEPGSLQVEPNGVQSIINQVTVNWLGGSITVDESAGSPYGPRPVTVDTLAQSAAIARGIGEWIIANNSTPRARIRSLGIDPGAAQTAFPIALGTRIGDRAAYRSHPQSVGAATTQALEVLGRHHAVQGLTWTADYYLTSAPNADTSLFLWDSSLLDGPAVLAY